MCGGWGGVGGGGGRFLWVRARAEAGSVVGWDAEAVAGGPAARQQHRARASGHKEGEAAQDATLARGAVEAATGGRWAAAAAALTGHGEARALGGLGHVHGRHGGGGGGRLGAHRQAHARGCRGCEGERTGGGRQQRRVRGATSSGACDAGAPCRGRRGGRPSSQARGPRGGATHSRHWVAKHKHGRQGSSARPVQACAPGLAWVRADRNLGQAGGSLTPDGAGAVRGGALLHAGGGCHGAGVLGAEGEGSG